MKKSQSPPKTFVFSPTLVNYEKGIIKYVKPTYTHTHTHAPGQYENKL